LPVCQVVEALEALGLVTDLPQVGAAR
jgi:hypothetical protein